MGKTGTVSQTQVQQRLKQALVQPAGAQKARVEKIIQHLKETYPKASTALHFQNPLELLVSTILSAQCTDVRVNQVTETLFQKYKTAQDYASAKLPVFEQEIRSTGFYKNKAKSITNCCKVLVEKYGGRVPNRMEDLVMLPGVGRKTANVVLGNGFGIPGIVVDTHVIRLSGRLALTPNTDPEKIEFDLMEVVPKKDWIIFSNLLILHGRAICVARTPHCSRCCINDLCPSAGMGD